MLSIINIFMQHLYLKIVYVLLNLEYWIEDLYVISLVH